MHNNQEHRLNIEKGIECLKSDTIKAINYFKTAYNLDPYKKDVYLNFGKSFMCIGQYALSMKSFLTYAHFLILERQDNYFEFDYTHYYKYFEFDNRINENTLIINSQDSIVKSNQHIAVSSFETTYTSQIEGTNLAKLITDLDLIASIGTCYITKHQDIIRYNNIPKQTLNNELYHIKGVEITGQNLRSSEYGKMAKTIGLLFLAKNLLTNPLITKNELINIYYSKEYSLDDL